MEPEKLKRTIKHVTDLLVAKSYADLEMLSNGVRLSADEMNQAVQDYGQNLVSLPEEGYTQLDVVEVENAEPKKWSVNVPIYTKEEGRSDLTLEITVVDSVSGQYGIEIDDLHVL